MSTASITVAFPDPPTDSDVHRIRNLAEALESNLGRALGASVEDTDSITSQIRVHLASSRHLGGVTGAIRKCLAQHNLLDVATVTIQR